jgi:hypothetical protein
MTRSLPYLICTTFLLLSAMEGTAVALTVPLTDGPRSAPASPAGITEPDTFTVMATFAGGYAHYIMPYPPGLEIDRRGWAFSARLLWHPDHRLRLGVESGWTTLYAYDLRDVETSFGRTDASLSLSAIPALVVFSMQVLGPVSLSAGVGGYFVRSHARSFGETVDVSRFSQGWMAAITVSRVLPFAPVFGLELKWYGATEFGDGVLMGQLLIQLNLLR